MIHLIEWVWTLVAGVGVISSVALWIQARQDVMFLLEKSFNGRRLIVARGHERREFVRGVTQALGLYVGIYALTTPNPTGSRIHAVTLCLVGMQVLIVANTVFDHRDRNRLRAYWESEREQP